MHRSTDMATYYQSNLPHFDRFLAFKGVANPGDRSDIVQTYILDLMQRETLMRADSCCQTDAHFRSYMTKCLQNHLVQWWRDQHPGEEIPSDMTSNDCSNLFEHLYIRDFKEWCDSPQVDRACDAILEDLPDCTRSNDYRLLQRYRNKFKKLKNKA